MIVGRASCTQGGGPPLNTDVSGIGVRISFYLQTLFLAYISARSGSLDEIIGALYTLIATSMAMAVASLLLGLKPIPEISFHDALVVFYLLAMSWFSVVFSLPSCYRFGRGLRILKILSILQSCIVFAFAFVILIQAKTFGSSPECNGNAVAVLFRPFSALRAGRIAGWVLTVLIVGIYVGITVKDYLPPPPKRIQQWMQRRRNKKRHSLAETQEADLSFNVDPLAQMHLEIRGQMFGNQQTVTPKYDLQIAWDLVVEILLITVLWVLAVMNTELLIRWNHFEPLDSPTSPWQFGQVLPMFLLVLPFVNMVSVFREFGLKPWQQSTGDQAQWSGSNRAGI